MIFPLGATINALAVVVGALIGMGLGRHISDRMKTSIFQVFGLCGLALGIQMSLACSDFILVLGSCALGMVTGEILRLEDRIEAFGDWLKRKVKSNDSRFTEGFVTCSIITCVGAMAILGSFEEGLSGKRTLLLVKSIFDLFLAILLGSVSGIGVLFAGLMILIYEGSLTIFATFLQPYMTEYITAAITATGGIMMLAIAVNVMEIKKVSISNMLPSLIYAVIFASIWGK